MAETSQTLSNALLARACSLHSQQASDFI